jgi:hypothetical protein
MLHRDAKALGRAVIEDVDRKSIEANCFSETVDDCSDVVEGVVEAAVAWEPRQRRLGGNAP